MALNERLITDRLILRHFTLADAPRVHELCDNWNVASKLARVPHPYPVRAAEDWISGHPEARAKGADYPFAISHGAKLIGAIGIQATDNTPEHYLQGDGVAKSDSTSLGHGLVMEIGYWLGEPYWGNGFATEAARRMVRFAFEELGLTALQAGYLVDNPDSGRVLRKLGFRHTGEEMSWCLARRCEVESTQMELTRQEAGF